MNISCIYLDAIVYTYNDLTYTFCIVNHNALLRVSRGGGQAAVRSAVRYSRARARERSGFFMNKS